MVFFLFSSHVPLLATWYGKHHRKSHALTVQADSDEAPSRRGSHYSCKHIAQARSMFFLFCSRAGAKAMPRPRGDKLPKMTVAVCAAMLGGMHSELG